ncbi:TonB-dependent receptor [Brevundimonas sp. Root1279]|uniref:TonB-dependent receptor n=1 Tax=Brevundimonas sp. Root1279 TaxID=1736443 RepID=UPI0006F3184B|nr:TonB-dependent receptor [Brevundimonas sp. Root1279]KQW82993.1 TonB-dependent receptor [Brevundimonas sp. Root1279]
MNTQVTRRTRLLASAAAGVVAALAFTGAASAQDAAQEATQVDEVVVTGIRSSIESSIAAKRENTSIVEVITAEDIGKLPDVSIAESLARLPGLTAQRLDGRSQAISIRGLGPDFTTALLNGREQVTTGDNRGVEFDQYPSELLSGVTVYKTPDAALIGQGLAGTVDLQTMRPLAYGRRAIAANVRYEVNDIGALNAGTNDDGVRYSISYIDQFANDTIGIALGYAHMTSPYQSERFNAWGYPSVGAGELVIGGVKPYVMSSELERDGFMGVVEFRPNEQWHTTFDAFYSKFDNTQIMRGIEFPLAWGGQAEATPGACAAGGNVQSPVCRPGPQLQPGYTIEDGMVTAGTFTNVKGVIRNDVNKRESEVKAFGFNTEYSPNERFTFEADLSYSGVERNDMVLETYSGTGRNIDGALDTLDFAINDDGVVQFDNQLDYADPNLIRLTSPQGWGGDVIPGGQDGYLNTPTINDELFAGRLQMTTIFDSGPFRSVDIGVNANSREKEFINDQYFLGVPGGASPLVPTAYLLEPTSLAYLGIDRVISYDALGLVRDGFYNQVRNPNSDVLAGNWQVEEKVTTAYMRANLDTQLGSMPLTGNFGFQTQFINQSSNGYAASGTGASTVSTPVSGGEEYTEFLPSMNLILEVADQRYVRVAAARVLARPRMDDMRASRQFSYNASLAGSTDINASPWGGSGGNPELRPWIANVYDVSFEQYFGRSAYVSLAAFYKDLDTFIYTRNSLEDFTGYPVNGPEPALRQGIISSPQNGEGGKIYGVEFAVSTPFDFMGSWAEGFGGQFSVSQTKSKIQPDPAAPPTAVPGLSETVANLTLYYEKNGLQARISNRYRSEFLGEVAGFGNGRTLRQVGAESVVDAQLGYEFQSGTLEGLSMLFQVNNMTDEPFFTYENGDERRIIDHQQYGRTFLFGVNYKY